MDIPPPAKKTRTLAPTPRSKAARLSVPWANGVLCTPAPPADGTLLEEENEDEDDGVLENGRDEGSLYQQVRDVGGGFLISFNPSGKSLITKRL